MSIPLPKRVYFTLENPDIPDDLIWDIYWAVAEYNLSDKRAILVILSDYFPRGLDASYMCRCLGSRYDVAAVRLAEMAREGLLEAVGAFDRGQYRLTRVYALSERGKRKVKEIKKKLGGSDENGN